MLYTIDQRVDDFKECRAARETTPQSRVVLSRSRGAQNKRRALQQNAPMHKRDPMRVGNSIALARLITSKINSNKFSHKTSLLQLAS
ncbi:MAG: hypothetical protein K8T25_17015 [Planctomycetia bacterium]|nr:hypothetical protein [Planctomycetia bacterium]